jgi:DNA invertase Pin-like site-specific DNA recombinase
LDYVFNFNDDFDMNRAIIYCRKSTDDEKNQQQSLDIQLEWTSHFIENNKNVRVIDTIVEAKSAFKIE